MLLTWLGHAAFLLTLPGARVLLDPCLSDRCSPLSWAGPQRLVAPPCKLEDLDPDVVVISHNHYDHLDLDVMKKLVQKKKDLLFFVPLGNKKLLGITNVVECDWWDSYSVHKPKTDVSPEANLQISCTPSQHFSSRTLWDKNQTLWSSWHIQSTAFSHETPPTTSTSNNDANHAHNTNHGHNHSNECDITTSSPRPITKSFFFGGDTGYRTVFTSEDEENAPTCPAFRQVREKFGDTDLAALPIGAYNPRHLLSNVHCSPKDAVEVHLDLGAKKSVAMHWGTFVLSREDVMEPPRLLREEMAKRGVREDEFLVIEVGETVSA
ncbi:beta-lactamase superfamily domain-containing protein [Obelidium mucronatum]|nr:beta-lactamase superfamily domain-containing protein [Obelidium mucronatum]